jgi:hypothetical protein
MFNIMPSGLIPDICNRFFSFSKHQSFLVNGKRVLFFEIKEAGV